jgi:hypothetical protein
VHTPVHTSKQAISSSRRPAPRPRREEPDGIPVQLETADGAPAEPSTLKTATPTWNEGDEIPLGHRSLRVIGKRDGDADQSPVLIVEHDECVWFWAMHGGNRSR